jgi:hypothetical protein
MFNWFDARDAQEFGASLAVFFMENISIETHGKKNKPMAKRKVVLDKMFLKIQLFKTKHQLNVYKKAKLWNAFKWKLLDANYDPDFVDELTKMLMLKC